ncbi:MAG: 2-oxoglutarate dehydrogenase E1 component [Armatimonadetes bacterium]|nr:2-oxoglutarate dehydrogenase E1 component [Armatimonadota bacterium]
MSSLHGGNAITGVNAGLVAELFERFLSDPQSVDADTRAFFDGGGYAPDASPAVSETPSVAFVTPATPAFDVNKVVATARLARLVRELGHKNARLDPLGTTPPGDPALELSTHGLTTADLEALPASVIGGHLANGAKNAAEALEKLRAVYSGSIGYEDDHIQVVAEREWLRDAVESGRFLIPLSAKEKRDLLLRLSEVDGFEQFLDKVPPFQGEKRFSIEGCDAMVPLLDTIISCTALSGTREVVMGMAHRGRLNVLAHVLNKPYTKILADFLPSAAGTGQERPANGAVGYYGDVKYHKGYTRAYAGEGGETMPITLAPNPSHLEFVNPVVVGRARAAQETRTGTGAPVRDNKASLAIIIHGDGAFPGQGIVAETLNMGGLRGYSVGGTIHVIANNQVAFTTDTEDSRSTLYSSDLAKGFEIPVVHVNGDDPAACVAVARMACAYHQKFGKDFLIDIVGYRRLGHNETDEPAFTQPRLYALINAHPRPREIWAQTLEKEGVVTKAEADELVKMVRAKLIAARDEVIANPPAPDTGASSEPASGDTAPPVDEATLRELNADLMRVPAGFNLHKKLQKQIVDARLAALDVEGGILWAHAESLAFASLLGEGIPIRLTGQDVQRGTFTQRHLVFHDTETGESFAPMQSLPNAKASFALHNSPLSESAAVGFEYGYSIHATETLVLWEAQFGDFANGAQVIIDQFIASGNAKWQQTPSLVLLLPHGYEGQGPEHSSGRVERFLQLCAASNMIVANCSNAAQYYHLLRRQGTQLKSHPRPLVVMTPKSLLRHPRAAATLSELTTGTFQTVLDDPRPAERKPAVTRLLLCSGKVYVDLLYIDVKFEYRAEYLDGNTVAVARIEQLYPFPEEKLAALFVEYPNLTEIVWVQEEPQNMGAWTFVAPRLAKMLPVGVALNYIGRPEAASPSEGKKTSHDREQARIVAAAYKVSPTETPVKTAPVGGDGLGRAEIAHVEEVVADTLPKEAETEKTYRNGVHSNGTGAKKTAATTEKSGELTKQRTEA